ncbi:hypothetical protein TWF718_001245 [Orbilia javanica]|uniref:Uncharacterized protein n=1 Tax=Orbilia javanica TaxID=47235 RepID=A0AAN8RML3_9PEZI
MCHWRYFHSCKETPNKWEKLVPGPFGDCKCNEETEVIEIKSCLTSCIPAEGYGPETIKHGPPKNGTSHEPQRELREAARDYKDGKIRATDLIKTFLGRLGR